MADPVTIDPHLGLYWRNRASDGLADSISLFAAAQPNHLHLLIGSGYEPHRQVSSVVLPPDVIRALGEYLTAHARRAQATTAPSPSAVPCAAWHMTFGGLCLNCGGIHRHLTSTR